MLFISVADYGIINAIFQSETPWHHGTCFTKPNPLVGLCLSLLKQPVIDIAGSFCNDFQIQKGRVVVKIIKKLSIFVVVWSALLVLCQLSVSAESPQADPQSKENRPAFPTLMQAIRFDRDIKFCGISVPLHQQDIKIRMEKEMLLALWDRAQVILWLKRSGQYFELIEKELKKHHLPEDYKYIPVIESALRPHVGSKKGAIGYWQFLRGTGKQYGLKINSQIDERRNIHKSTQAACRYLTKLHQQFDSYLLAMAAFNMGHAALKAEIDAQENTDFFSLYLPLETQAYILKIICAKLIIENPQKYGFDLSPEDFYPAVESDRIKLKTNITVPVLAVAKAANTSFKTIKDMNPELRGYYIGKGVTWLMIPKGTAEGFKQRFQKSLKAHGADKPKKRFHVVKSGENLSLIARKYDMSLSRLMKMNHLARGRVIHPGDRLVVE